MNKTYLVDTPDEGRIALHRVCPDAPQGFPVILAHGAFSNGETMRALADYLCSLNFDCWILEWAGHGESINPDSKNNFEYFAFNDARIAIDFVLKTSLKEKIFWVSHSGGGMALLMYLARYPDMSNHIAGKVLLGAQVSDSALQFKSKMRAFASWTIVTALNGMPKKLFSSATEGETSRLVAQWASWNLRKKWLGTDGFNYMQALENITSPAFIIAGAGDDIAPASGCKKILDALGGEEKQYLVCSTENGFAKNYNHSQLIYGLNAKTEVYPKIGAWLVTL